MECISGIDGVGLLLPAGGQFVHNPNVYCPTTAERNVDEPREPRRTRLRLDSLDFQVFPDGRCSVRVRMEWKGRTYEGSADGIEAMEGALRTAVRATLAAATAATEDRLHLTLMGLKTVKAFDEIVVIVNVRGRGGDQSYQLMGCQASKEEKLVDAAARTALDAINRVVELYVPDDAPAPS